MSTAENTTQIGSVSWLLPVSNYPQKCDSCSHAWGQQAKYTNFQASGERETLNRKRLTDREKIRPTCSHVLACRDARDCLHHPHSKFEFSLKFEHDHQNPDLFTHLLPLVFHFLAIMPPGLSSAVSRARASDITGAYVVPDDNEEDPTRNCWYQEGGSWRDCAKTDRE